MTPPDGCRGCWACLGAHLCRPAGRAAGAAFCSSVGTCASQLDAQALFDQPDELRLSPLLGDYSTERTMRS
jgi:hypothetical protein